MLKVKQYLRNAREGVLCDCNKTYMKFNNHREQKVTLNLKYTVCCIWKSHSYDGVWVYVVTFPYPSLKGNFEEPISLIYKNNRLLERYYNSFLMIRQQV